MNGRKYLPSGGQWNPTPPLPTITPWLPKLSKETLKADHDNAVEWINFTKSAVRNDGIAPEDHYTLNDPEWPTHLFIAAGEPSDPGPILRPMIEARREELGCTRIEAGARIVGMDTAAEIADKTTRWALMTPGVEIAKRYRRCEEPHLDLIGHAFALGAFMQHRVDEVVDVIFAEKFWQEEALELRDDVAEYGWRPEIIIEHQSGLSCAVVTTYGTDGSPAMGERPEGHSFWAYLMKRAAMFLNGPGVDKALYVTGRMGPMLRVPAGVHTVRSAQEGCDISEEMASPSSKIWKAVDLARASGAWPERGW